MKSLNTGSLMNEMSRSVVVEKFGGPEKLLIKKVGIPKPNQDEILIKVVTAGINPADIEQRKGEYLPPTDASSVLGLEVAGTIVEVSGNVTEFKAGDRVMSLLSGGGYADYVVAHKDLSFFIPSFMSFSEAAAIPEAIFTVWSTIFDNAKLKKGEVILIHGGTGSVGSIAIQLAHHFEAEVIATAGTDDKCALCSKLGADKTINYRKENFFALANEYARNKGVDVILDFIGGEYLNDHLKLLARCGRLLLIDCQDANPNIDLNSVIIKNLSISGAVLRSRPLLEKIAIAHRIKRYVMPLLIDGKIKPIIAKIFPLVDVINAHKLMESKNYTGKIILEMTTHG